MRFIRKRNRKNKNDEDQYYGENNADFAKIDICKNIWNDCMNKYAKNIKCTWDDINWIEENTRE